MIGLSAGAAELRTLACCSRAQRSWGDSAPAARLALQLQSDNEGEQLRAARALARLHLPPSVASLYAESVRRAAVSPSRHLRAVSVGLLLTFGEVGRPHLDVLLGQAQAIVDEMRDNEHMFVDLWQAGLSSNLVPATRYRCATAMVADDKEWMLQQFPLLVSVLLKHERCIISR